MSRQDYADDFEDAEELYPLALTRAERAALYARMQEDLDKLTETEQ